MWSGGFRVTLLPSSSATPSGHSHRVFAENTHCLCPSRPGARLYLHPLISIHFAALDQLDVERLLQGPEGHGGGLGRVGGRIGVLRQRNSEKADEACATGDGVRVLQVYSQVWYLPTVPSFTRKPAAGTPPRPQGPRTLQGTQSCLQGRKQEEQEERAAREPGLEAALGHPDRPPTQLKGPILSPEQSKGMGPGRRPLAHSVAQ